MSKISVKRAKNKATNGGESRPIEGNDGQKWSSGHFRAFIKNRFFW